MRERKAFNTKVAADARDSETEAEAAAEAASKAEVDGRRIPQVDVSRLPFFRYSAVKVTMGSFSPNSCSTIAVYRSLTCSSKF